MLGRSAEGEGGQGKLEVDNICKWVTESVGRRRRGRGEQVIFKPLAQLSLPIHLCLGSVPCTSSRTKEALHQHSGRTDGRTRGFDGKTLSSRALAKSAALFSFFFVQMLLVGHPCKLKKARAAIPAAATSQSMTPQQYPLVLSFTQRPYSSHI